MRSIFAWGRWPLGLAAVAFLFIAGASAVACGDDDPEDDCCAPSPTLDEPTSTGTTQSQSGASPTGSNETPSAQSPVPGSANPEGLDEFLAQDYPDELKNGYDLGATDAPVVLRVFEDFQCPFCLRWSLTQEPTLIEEYVIPGDVRLEFRNLPILGDESAYAAIGAECAARQNMFWEFHKILFEVQARAGQLTEEELNVGRFSLPALQALAQDAGLSEVDFALCIEADDALADVIAHTREAQELGLRSTPSFVLNGQVLPGTPSNVDALREILDEAIENAP